MDAFDLATVQARRQAALAALIDLARAAGLTKGQTAERLANQCLELFEADLQAVKLTGEEPVRGYRADEVSGTS